MRLPPILLLLLPCACVPVAGPPLRAPLPPRAGAHPGSYVIAFRSDAATLGEAARVALARAADAEAVRPAACVVVRGFAAAFEHPRRLALLRANAVADELRRDGVGLPISLRSGRAGARAEVTWQNRGCSGGGRR